MGYLEANRFGYAIAGSHSSRTAEGDNSVLMNKVASELFQRIMKKKETKAIMMTVIKQKLFSAPSFTIGRSVNIGSMINLMALFKDRAMADLFVKMGKVNIL